MEPVSSKNDIIKNCRLEDVITTITFSRYLTFSEFEKLVQDYDVQIVQLQLRGLTDDGDRVSIFTRTDKGLVQTEKIVKLKAVDEFELTGITGVYALVDSGRIAELEQDARVYLVDTSGDYYFELAEDAQTLNLNESAIVDSTYRNGLAGSSIGKMFPKSVTWQLEDLGLL